MRLDRQIRPASMRHFALFCWRFGNLKPVYQLASIGRIGRQMMVPPVLEEKTSKRRLFAPNYRAGDALLTGMFVGGAVFSYLSFQRGIPFAWPHVGVLGVFVIAVLGLLRVRLAFALLSLPFFVWAGYSCVRWLFFPPRWADLFASSAESVGGLRLGESP